MSTTPNPTPWAGTAIEWSDLKPIWDSVVTIITPANVIGILAGAAGACIALVFMWWGIRKVTRMIMSAFQKGRLSI